MKIVFAFGVLISVCGICAINAQPVFDSYEWSFGSIKESNGAVSHAFLLKNQGKADLLLSKVLPSCSCVTVDYPRNPIKVGETEQVIVTFTPSGAAGRVFRTVDVFDADNYCIGTLEISADVTPSDRNIQDRFKYTLAPQLYVSRIKVPFGYVFHGQQLSKSIVLANSGSTPIQLQSFHTSNYLHIDLPASVQPGEEKSVQLTYTAPSQPDFFATITDTVWFKANGQSVHQPIIVHMFCTAYYSLTDDSPSLRTYPSEVHWSKKSKNRLVANIDVFNDGTSDLKLHHIELPDGVTANLKEEHVIKTGGHDILQLTTSFDSSFILRLFTNDPIRLVKEIQINNSLKQ